MMGCLLRPAWGDRRTALGPAAAYVQVKLDKDDWLTCSRHHRLGLGAPHLQVQQCPPRVVKAQRERCGKTLRLPEGSPVRAWDPGSGCRRPAAGARSGLGAGASGGHVTAGAAARAALVRLGAACTTCTHLSPSCRCPPSARATFLPGTAATGTPAATSLSGAALRCSCPSWVCPAGPPAHHRPLPCRLLHLASPSSQPTPLPLLPRAAGWPRA
jgi:hypothetical protein